MEPCAKKITRKNNPILVAAVFRLMFETLWIPPYDRRRCNALVADFDLCARSAVTRLAATDLAAASGIELDEMRYAVECLLRSIERLDAARLLPPDPALEPFDFKALRQMTDAMSLQEESAGDLIRRMRDGSPY